MVKGDVRGGGVNANMKSVDVCCAREKVHAPYRDDDGEGNDDGTASHQWKSFMAKVRAPIVSTLMAILMNTSVVLLVMMRSDADDESDAACDYQNEVVKWHK